MDKMSVPASACSVCVYRSAGQEHWLRGPPGVFGSRGLISRIGQAGELGGCLSASQDNPETLGLQRTLWGYSECQPGLLYSGPLPGLRLRSLSPTLVNIHPSILAEP